MLVLSMMMKNKIKHINTSKQICVNLFPVKFFRSMIPYVTLAYDDGKQNKSHKQIQANMCKLVNHFHVILIPIYYEPIKGLATTIINY